MTRSLFSLPLCLALRPPKQQPVIQLRHRRDHLPVSCLLPVSVRAAPSCRLHPATQIRHRSIALPGTDRHLGLLVLLKAISKKADTGWLGKNVFPPAPPYKAPIQTIADYNIAEYISYSGKIPNNYSEPFEAYWETTFDHSSSETIQTSAKDTLQAKVSADVVDISESEDKGKGISDSDSEEWDAVWRGMGEVYRCSHNSLRGRCNREKINKADRDLPPCCHTWDWGAVQWQRWRY
jgi:hypothetical protein